MAKGLELHYNSFPDFEQDYNGFSTSVKSKIISKTIANNPKLFSKIVSDETAMNAVAVSEVARDAIWNSKLAWDKVKVSNMAVGKYVAGAAGLNPEDYADMDAIAASEEAMNAVAASEAAIAAIVKSELASDIIKEAIQNYIETIRQTLDNSSFFVKEDINTGVLENLPNGTYIVQNGDVIVFPYEMSAESTLAWSGTFGLAYGTDPNFKLCEFNITTTVHSINAVSFRGLIYFTHSNNADPYVKYYKYTLSV